jgi:hypothetical protein
LRKAVDDPTLTVRKLDSLELTPDTGRPTAMKGRTALLVAVAVVVGLSVAWPAYRLFFLISIGIGIVIAGGLYLWHRVKPVKEEDVETKRPLGL